MTTNSSSSALQAVHYSRQLIEKGEGSPEEHTLRRLCQEQAGTPRTITRIPKDTLPFRGSYRQSLTVVDARWREVRQSDETNQHQRSIQIRTMIVAMTDHLNLASELLIPCASLLTVSRTI